MPMAGRGRGGSPMPRNPAGRTQQHNSATVQCTMHNAQRMHYVIIMRRCGIIALSRYRN